MHSALLTAEPHRAEQMLEMRRLGTSYAWDCIRGIRDLDTLNVIDQVRDPVAAIETGSKQGRIPYC